MVKISRKEVSLMNEKVLKNSEILATDEYIQSRLSAFDLCGIYLQVGPNCNLNCKHCYGNYGTRRKGLPSARMVQSLLEQTTNLWFDHLSLTDGEPIREENREIMRVVSNYSDKITTIIITNAKFADTKENAVDWMHFLKDNGFDLGKNYIKSSFGLTYDVRIQNHMNLLEATRSVYPEINLSSHLGFSQLTLGAKEDKALFNGFLIILDRLLGKEKESSIKLFKHKSGQHGAYYFPEKGKEKNIISIEHDWCEAEGRALKIQPVLDRNPLLTLEFDKIPFNPLHPTNLAVDWQGNITAGCAQAEKIGKQNYGNIFHEKLLKIAAGVISDPLYMAFRLGGLRFTYHLAREINPDFKIQARSYYIANSAIYKNEYLTQKIREKLEKSTIEKEYKGYIERRGIPEVSPFVSP